jgi:hypothetical protein
MTSQPKKRRTKEDIDLTWAPGLEGAESALRSLNRDSIGLKVLAATNMLFEIYDKVCSLHNVSSSQQQIPACTPMLEFSQVGEEQQVGEEEAPTPSTGTSTSRSKGKKQQGSKRRRGEHGRHKVDRREEVHEIHEVGPMGEPIRPTEVIAVFSNQDAIITRDKVEITWENWNTILEAYKELI